MGEQKPEKTKKHICAGLLAHVIDGYCKENPAQRKISLNVVKRLAKEKVSYDRLREAVDEAIVCSDSYYMGK